jgi:hypothetical protein
MKVVQLEKMACPVQNPVLRASVLGQSIAPHCPKKGHSGSGLVSSIGPQSHALSFHGIAKAVSLDRRVLHVGLQAGVVRFFVSGLCLLCCLLSASETFRPVDRAGRLYSAVAGPVSAAIAGQLDLSPRSQVPSLVADPHDLNPALGV